MILATGEMARRMRKREGVQMQMEKMRYPAVQLVDVPPVTNVRRFAREYLVCNLAIPVGEFGDNVRPCVTGHPAWRDAADTPQHNKRNNGLKAYRLSG
jgi:hypothetical protein